MPASLPASGARGCARIAPKWRASVAVPMRIGNTGDDPYPPLAIRGRACWCSALRLARMAPTAPAGPSLAMVRAIFFIRCCTRQALPRSAKCRIARRRHEAHRALDQRRGPLRSAGQQAYTRGAAQLRAMARRGDGLLRNLRVVVCLGALPSMACSPTRSAREHCFRSGYMFAPRRRIHFAERLAGDRQLSSFAAEHQYRQADATHVSRCF